MEITYEHTLTAQQNSTLKEVELLFNVILCYLMHRRSKAFWK